MVALSTKLKEQQEQVALRTAAGAKALATLKRQTTVAIAQAKKAACAVASVRSSAPPSQLPPPPLEPATSELTPAPPPTPPPVLSPQSSDALVASRGEPCGEALVSSSAPPSQLPPLQLESASSELPPAPPPTEPLVLSHQPSVALSGGAAEADSVCVGVLVQVGVEVRKGGAKYCGEWGRVETATSTLAQFRNQSGMLRRVPKTSLLPISMEPRAPGPWKKNILYLTASQQKLCKDKGLLEFPEEPVSVASLLSESELAIGCFEILWRLTPVRAVVVPPYLVSLCGFHVLNHWAAHDRSDEGAHLVAQFLAYAERAELLLCPILANGHWTLLVLQRAGSSGTVAVGGAKHDAEVAGCTKCEMNPAGCISCSGAKALVYVERHEAEDSAIDPLRLDTLPPTGWWDIRYYDSLKVGTKRGAEMAIALVDLMQQLNAVNTQTVDDFRGAARSGRMVQQALDCSWYCLHYIEEEVRRFMGEGTLASVSYFFLRFSIFLCYFLGPRSC